MRMPFVLFAALLFAGVPALAGERLSFKAALERLETHNETLDAARRQSEQATARLSEASGQRWPSLTLEGRATRMNAPLSADLSPVRRVLLLIDPDLPADQLPERFDFQSRQFYNLYAEATWTIYAGGRIRAGIDAADAGEAGSLAQFSDQLGQLRLELVKRYFGQGLAAEALEVRRQTVSSLERHLRDARQLEQEGQIARAERLRADVAYAEALRDLELAHQDLAFAQSALAALLASERYFQTTTSIPPLPDAPALAGIEQYALKHNPLLQAGRFQLEQAEFAVRAARGEYWPTVSLFARHELYTQDLTLVQPDWAVGVAARWSLFEGTRRRAKIATAQARAAEANSRIAAASRDVRLLVEQHHQAVHSAEVRLRSFVATRELASESLRAQQRAFEEGLASSLDVVDAELALSRVRLGELAARFEGLVALAGLYTAAGMSEHIVQLANPDANSS